MFASIDTVSIQAPAGYVLSEVGRDRRRVVSLWPTLAQARAAGGEWYEVEQDLAGPDAGVPARAATLLEFDGPQGPARIAAARLAFHDRLAPLLRATPGCVRVLVLWQPETCAHVVVSLATSLPALAAIGQAVNTSPLLPGEDPALLPGPDRVAINEVTDRPAIATGTYTIDPVRTTVSFTVKEMWGLVKVRGTFTVTAGTIVVADDPAQSSVRVELDPASFASGSKRRDKDVTGKNFLAATAYPDMGFTGNGAAYGPDGWTMRGALTVHGVTAPVTLRLVSGRETTDGCAFVATAVVDRTAHGVSRGAGLIARELTVEISVVAQ
ncbi:YceI family protein [Phytohabitans rumicis]|uniref:Lipid/polyisoprenoid-binding YceI-like domain-containing protein n=1 Tax=Phytohabitans rumicis TaxID=1076125 RepID=A0A6V8LCX5_9ACTN|nr:YceI family protein [Phytohabitans rumicis]GFJ95072.1 hypothetical protein Prum_087140 [Phytohabitans rumicis]